MSLDAIKQISKAEELAEVRRQDAIASAKKMLSDAEEAGMKKAEALETDARSKVKSLLEQTEKSSKEIASQIAAEAKKTGGRSGADSCPQYG